MNDEAKKRNSKIRVVHLDYHSMFCEGIKALLADQAQLEMAGHAGEGQAALALVTQLKPDIILLELNLDCELNSEIIPELLENASDAHIILLTAVSEPDILQLAVQMGVMGILHKTDGKRLLVKAIEKVHAGEVWIDRTMMANVLTRLSRRDESENNQERLRIQSISERELEVIALVGRGLKNKEIAECMTISEATVRHHLTSVYSKLDVSDRLELAIFAYRHDLADLPK